MNPSNCITKLFVFIILSAIVLITVTSHVYAAKGEKNRPLPKKAKLWQQVEARSLQSRGQGSLRPNEIPVYRLTQRVLNGILEEAPLEFTDAARLNKVVLEIPTPEGNFVRFRIEESPMLAPEIAAQFPTWKTFSGQGIDDPTALARFDININGFHGYVSGANGTFLIDPYSLTDRNNYIVYYKGDLMGNRESFSCNVGWRIGNNDDLLSADAPAAFSNGNKSRTYRLAVAATKEYTNFFGGNVNTAFAAIQTTVNRMNLIYRRDLATTFTLVTGTNHVFTNANNGGYPDASNPNVANDSLTRNQQVMDNGNGGNPAALGNANYDIGHVLSRTPNPNGLASSPSLCNDSSKAQGFTGAQTPQGDGFDVDYVAHEIGHQFGMSHTFNNDADGSCTTRSAHSAYEPASGVTIMAYGGICAPRNLSANSIEYFNLRSFDQSLKWISDIENGVYSGINPACGNAANNTNTVPQVTSPGNFTIPRLTPFTLRATALDANGDALTYLWEEFDLGAATRSTGAMDDDATGERPIFRAYNATTNPARTFPSLHYILNPAANETPGSNQPTLTYTGTLPFAPTSGSTNGYVCAPAEICVRGERLPNIGRIMNFRVTVRDNNMNGGGIADAQSTITVKATAGPFQITTQNARSAFAPDATWQAGTLQTVTWDVAGTNANDINVANVKISLSTDGGQTFPITILASTANDGSEEITVPNNPTTAARIKVEAINNIFFDINNANFQITAAPTAASVSISGRIITPQELGLNNALVTLTDPRGEARTVLTGKFGSFRFTNVTAGETYILSVSSKRYTYQPQVITVMEDITGLSIAPVQ